MMTNELKADEERRLRALVHILEYFQAHEPQIPASMIEAFLLVALNEGCSLRDIVELSGKPQSTISRHILDLGERNRRMGPGLGLVAWRIAPTNCAARSTRAPAQVGNRAPIT
jgi:hypothetical protein